MRPLLALNGQGFIDCRVQNANWRVKNARREFGRGRECEPQIAQIFTDFRAGFEQKRTKGAMDVLIVARAWSCLTLVCSLSEQLPAKQQDSQTGSKVPAQSGVCGG